MYKISLVFLTSIFLWGCKDSVEKIKPSIGSITESIYASGIVKSKNQYQAYASVNGIINVIYVTEGDTVKKGTPLLRIGNETQILNKENAELAATLSNINANQGKINEADQLVELARNKMKNDSALYFRQKKLWEQNIGSKVEFEQRELAYQNAKTSYFSTAVKLNDLKRQLNFNSIQSKNNLQISNNLENDFIVKSEIDGIVYSVQKSKGEIVGLQTPIAIIGDAKEFDLEMQVDEYDILKIKLGQRIIVSLDSYKGKVFEAKVTKINPLMNERSKTFLIKAEFIDQPPTLYPNISFEANIILKSKDNALLIPRRYLQNDSIVTKANGTKTIIKIGLKDYQLVEIISGLTITDEIIDPNE